MSLENYNVQTDGGYTTTLRLSPDGAKRRGLTDADKVSSTTRDAASGTQPLPQQPPLSPEVTDLSKYKVGDVTAYLQGAGDEERARIIALEQSAAKPRTTITEWTPAQ